MSTIDPAAAPTDTAVRDTGTRACGLRYWTGFVCVPLMFASMLTATLLVGSDGDGAPADELAAFAHGGAAQLVPFLELINALAFIGLASFFGSSIRTGRGSWFATVGMGVSILGAVGSVMVSMRHFYDIALAGIQQGEGLKVLSALDSATGPLPLVVISLAPVVGLLLLAIAAFLARRASVIALALAVAFAVLEYTPLPESIGLVVGGVAFTWIAIRLVRTRITM